MNDNRIVGSEICVYYLYWRTFYYMAAVLLLYFKYASSNILEKNLSTDIEVGTASIFS